MKKLLICTVPVVLMAAHAMGAPPAGWGGVTAAAGRDDTPLVLAQARRGGGANINRANVNRGTVNRANVNRTNFNANNFQRDVTVNRNVSVSGGNWGPNWGGVAAGVAVGAGVTAVASAATAAATSASYPPPPPYPYYPYGY